jgi:hypothetical protein
VTSLATVGAYFVAAVTSGHAQPWWPYVLLVGLMALGGLLYLIGQRSSRVHASEATTADTVAGEDHALTETSTRPAEPVPQTEADAEVSADHTLVVRVYNFDMHARHANSRAGGRLPGILLDQLLRLNLTAIRENDSRKNPVTIWQTRSAPASADIDHIRRLAPFVLVTGYVTDADTHGRFAASIRVSLVEKDTRPQPLLIEHIQFEDTEQSMTEALGDLATKIWQQAADAQARKYGAAE